MSTVNATIDASVREVWDALVDVRTYPTWLIGATEIRSIDDGWPAPGTAFHHKVGLGGPLTIADRTRCDAVEPPHVLRLDVRAWPLMHGKVTFTLRPGDDGTEVDMEEHPIGVHRVLSPVLGPLSQVRNRASLERLEERVRERREGRA